MGNDYKKHDIFLKKIRELGWQVVEEFDEQSASVSLTLYRYVEEVYFSFTLTPTENGDYHRALIQHAKNYQYDKDLKDRLINDQSFEESFSVQKALNIFLEYDGILRNTANEMN